MKCIFTYDKKYIYMKKPPSHWSYGSELVVLEAVRL